MFDIRAIFLTVSITKFESHSFPIFLYIVSIKMILHLTFPFTILLFSFLFTF